jgi:hypothetical protein
LADIIGSGAPRKCYSVFVTGELFELAGTEKNGLNETNSAGGYLRIELLGVNEAEEQRLKC